MQLMQGIYASLEDSYAPPRPPAPSVPRSGAQSPSNSEGGASADSVQVRGVLWTVSTHRRDQRIVLGSQRRRELLAVSAGVLTVQRALLLFPLVVRIAADSTKVLTLHQIDLCANAGRVRFQQQPQLADEFGDPRPWGGSHGVHAVLKWWWRRRHWWPRPRRERADA